MHRSSIGIAISVILGLVVQSHAQCGTADPNKPDPPQGTAVFASLDATGVRIWECSKGAIADPTKVDATANFTGTSYSGTWDGDSWSGNPEPNGWTGNFVYVNGIAQFTLVRTSTSKTYAFHLSAKPVLDSTTPAGQLAPARWELIWDGPAPAGVDANATAFLVRRNISGGALPGKCATTNATEVEVPYTSTYDILVCTTAVSSAFVAAKTTGLAAFGIGLVAFLF